MVIVIVVIVIYLIYTVYEESLKERERERESVMVNVANVEMFSPEVPVIQGIVV